MRISEAKIILSASDLTGHLNCRHLTALDLEVAKGTRSKPKVWDPVLELLAERGALHEAAYVDYLREGGSKVAHVSGSGIDSASMIETLDAMRSGVSVIVQGALQVGQWSGRADILRRVETPSGLGLWSYEVIDTKLARETKGNTVLQVSLYSDLLGSLQEQVPEFAYVIVPETGYEPQAFRIGDYAAYYRRVRRSLEQSVETAGIAENYPEPNLHCEVCRWRMYCDGRRRADDHLSFVAGISKAQITELRTHGVGTVAELSALPVPMPWKPERGAVQSYEKVREQARIQVEGRTAGRTIHELLPVVSGFGLTRLPVPSRGDVFLDFEGDPFVSGGGLEFLFGYAFEADDGSPSYTADWALSRAEEKAAFEKFIDFVQVRLKRNPDLHVYHFAPYEPAALKRLMGRYATRENELDQMLRAGIFVDLYAVVRHSIRASVESYSIKKLEPLYAFTRTAPLEDVGAMMTKVQACLELGDVEAIDEQHKLVVQIYNQDDCLSTWHLRGWLEELRDQLIVSGTPVDRPEPQTGEVGVGLTEWQVRIAELIARLTHNVPVNQTERTPDQHARWLLAYLLDFHRREEKSAWWEYFRLAALSSEDLMEERSALAGLEFVGHAGGTVRAPIHRYSFPPQETQIRGGEHLHSIGGAKFGKVEAISLEDCTVDIKKRQDTAGQHPAAVFAHEVIKSKVLAESLVRIGEHVAANGIAGEGPYQPARDLLLLTAPRIGGVPIKLPDEPTLSAAVRIAPQLAGGVFPIQGPPGAGKTHTGAHMLCTLARSGKRAGITANSHKVIRNLLDGARKTATEAGFAIRCVQKVSELEDSLPDLQFVTDNAGPLEAFEAGCHVAGGTAWLWARPEFHEAVDVLFVDEAAQMCLANVLAVSQAARNVVLLGDPRQLEQPTQGSHPEGTDVSALDHILGTHATIPPDRGLFLEETWRLHPKICAFTSEVFYESRLLSRPDLDRQTITSKSRINGSGLRYLPVAHEGNQNTAPEEADQIHLLVEEILSSGSVWSDRESVVRTIGLHDILIIAPYNAQVFELQQRIPGGRVGTVDKFQGQEAPIVIYSITTSSHADAPRGMEFLYSANRLNVATSRAKCVCILVGSPSVFEAECRTPRQMQLANAFCRYLEMATII